MLRVESGLEAALVWTSGWQMMTDMRPWQWGEGSSEVLGRDPPGKAWGLVR